MLPLSNLATEKLNTTYSQISSLLKNPRIPEGCVKGTSQHHNRSDLGSVSRKHQASLLVEFRISECGLSQKLPTWLSKGANKTDPDSDPQIRVDLNFVTETGPQPLRTGTSESSVTHIATLNSCVPHLLWNCEEPAGWWVFPQWDYCWCTAHAFHRQQKCR